MEDFSQQRIGKRRSIGMFFALVACGVLLNILGTTVNGWLGLPFYFDNIGTILTALVGGYLPCIAVGFFYNLIVGIGDPITTYYCFISVIIAWAAAFFVRIGWLNRFPHMLAAVLVFAAFGGVVGGVLTWFLYGFSVGEGVAGVMTEQMMRLTGMPSFAAGLLANFFIDIVDKLITTLISLLIWKLLPKRLLAYYNVFRRQIAFRRSAAVGVKRKKFSLRSKVLLLVASSTTLVAVSVVMVCVYQFHQSTVQSYAEQGRSVTTMMAQMINPEKIEAYVQKGNADDEYHDIEQTLYSVNAGVPEITYIYVYQIREDGARVVFDLDTAQTEADEPGEIVPLDDFMQAHLDEFLAGKEVENAVTNDEYGWLLTVYQPFGEGKNLCYAAVDLSMDRLRSLELAFLTRIVSLFLGFLSLILIFALWIAEHFIADPINRITAATLHFAYDSPDARRESVKCICGLDIQTGDEIESLKNAIQKTTSDTMGYIEEVQKHGERISNLQNGLIMVLADMVESRDSYTGDHIRKTAAYTRIILEQMRRDGIYADRLTDAYIEDVINSAPLHDIGKIHVPDAVLNKPGRLTDEEFALMREHTTAGSEIIEKAIRTVGGDSGYLKEAKNLAAYHHEKWNGTGYPSGLAGEEIPLSARVMAVADVFDALVSRRVYKPPFPIDKAIDIIRADAGTHFDAKVVEAFLHAEPEIRKVAEEHETES